jgi:hypothetical protein
LFVARVLSKSSALIWPTRISCLPFNAIYLHFSSSLDSRKFEPMLSAKQ